METVQSALIPGSNDPAVVMDIYRHLLAAALIGNDAKRDTRVDTPFFWYDAMMCTEVPDYASLFKQHSNIVQSAVSLR